MAETEGRILNRVGVLMALLVVAALVAAGLAVASMMLATVLERRAEIGLFKALGATDARVAAVFLLEACAIGVLGGVAGYFFGSLLAWRLALAVFGSAVGVHWVILPVCLAAGALGNAGGQRPAAGPSPENFALARAARLKHGSGHRIGPLSSCERPKSWQDATQSTFCKMTRWPDDQPIESR